MNSGKKYSLRKRLQYRLDDFISKGFWAQLALLFGCVILLSTICAVLLLLFTEQRDFEEMAWDSLMHLIDQGTITGDETDESSYLFIMLAITFIGMAFTSVIIGITGNAVQQKMNELNKGHSRIIEKNHVVVLGFNNNTHTIINELEAGNERKKGNHCVVIADDMSKEEMEHTVREVNWSGQDLSEDEERTRKKAKKTDILFRSGDLVSENTFVMCAADMARAVIVNGKDDFETIRIILALTAYLKKAGAYIDNDRMPSVVALIRRKENLSAAWIAAGVPDDGEPAGKNGYKVRILYFRELLAKIFAQVCVQPGLSVVMSDLLNCSNSSFYIEDKTVGEKAGIQAAMEGKNIAEIAQMTEGAVPVGFTGTAPDLRTRVMLAPGPGVKYSPEKMLVYLADDDTGLKLRTDSAEEPVGEPAAVEGSREKAAKHFLILANSSSLPRLLKNMNDYCEDGSGINIIAPEDAGWDEEELDSFATCNVITDDPYNWEHTRKHLEAHPYWLDINDERHLTNLIIFSDDSAEPEQADEKVMVLLLNIRRYLEKNCSFAISITTEAKFPQNQALVSSMSSNDFVVGSQAANRLMVQVAEDPRKYYIFEELLSRQGNAVTLKPFSDYVDTSRPFNYEGICRQVFSMAGKTGKQEIPMGWIRFCGCESHIDAADEAYQQLVLNPSSEERSRLFADTDGRNFDNCKLVLLADTGR